MVYDCESTDLEIVQKLDIMAVKFIDEDWTICHDNAHHREAIWRDGIKGTVSAGRREIALNHPLYTRV